jgi:hypothetical protein
MKLQITLALYDSFTSRVLFCQHSYLLRSSTERGVLKSTTAHKVVQNFRGRPIQSSDPCLLSIRQVRAFNPRFIASLADSDITSNRGCHVIKFATNKVLPQGTSLVDEMQPRKLIIPVRCLAFSSATAGALIIARSQDILINLLTSRRRQYRSG